MILIKGNKVLLDEDTQIYIIEKIDNIQTYKYNHKSIQSICNNYKILNGT